MKLLKRGAQRRQQARADRRTPSFRTASTLARGVSVIRTFACVHGDLRDFREVGLPLLMGIVHEVKGLPARIGGIAICRFEDSFLPLREEHGF